MNIINIIRRCNPMIFTRFSCQMSTFPKFQIGKQQNPKEKILIIDNSEKSTVLPADKIKEFEEKNTVSFSQRKEGQQNDINVSVFNSKSIKNIKQIKSETFIGFSKTFRTLQNYLGLASSLLYKGYKFSRKQKQSNGPTIFLRQFDTLDHILELTNSKIRSAEWANLRGNEGNPEYFLAEAFRISSSYKNIKMTVIKGDKLLEQGFRLMHAVGRASKNAPIFICLQYRGGEQSNKFHGLVGKGLCFDTGGLHLKPTAGINDMHIDKHGATSVLSAFETVAKLQLKQNVVAAIGLAQNFIDNNSYRPLDIIKSRKGLTVQIGNTDAEGRLVLADCMSYVQQKYQLKDLIELSTLTGAIVIALGKERAGLFSNNNNLKQKLITASTQVDDLVWGFPIDDYHRQLVKSKSADITNSSGKSFGASIQAAAFLQNFVQKDIPWAHIDIAGTGMLQTGASGYGARLLINYLQHQQEKDKNKNKDKSTSSPSPAPTPNTK